MNARNVDRAVCIQKVGVPGAPVVAGQNVAVFTMSESKCRVARAVDGSLTDLTLPIFRKTTGRQRAFDGFDGFDGFSLEGYAHARARHHISRLLCLGVERIRQIRQIRQLPSAVLRLVARCLPSNRRQTAVKWGCHPCRV